MALTRLGHSCAIERTITPSSTTPATAMLSSETTTASARGITVDSQRTTGPASAVTMREKKSAITTGIARLSR